MVVAGALVAAVLAAVAVALVVSGDEPSAADAYLDGGGDSYRSAEGRFRARFPETPEVQTQQVPVVGGDPLGVTFVISDQLDQAVTVSWTDFGPQLALDLTGVAGGAAESVGGEVVSNLPVRYRGHDAIEFVIRSDREGGTVVVQRNFLEGRRLYALQTVARSRARAEDLLEVLADSFALTG